jgi:GxxExxY protein
MTNYCEPSKELNAIGTKVVNAAHKVHNKLGPGLLEHAYQAAMCRELSKMGLNVQTEVYIPIRYDDELIIENAYRIDILVENQVVIELKTVEQFSPVHFRQIRTYLKFSNKQLGYLLNFNTVLMTNGIDRQIMSSTCE